MKPHRDSHTLPSRFARVRSLIYRQSKPAEPWFATLTKTSHGWPNPVVDSAARATALMKKRGTELRFRRALARPSGAAPNVARGMSDAGRQAE